MKRNKYVSVLISCFLLVTFCFLSVAMEAAEKDAVGAGSGKVIIRSVPMKCEVSFLDQNIQQNIQKDKEQITIDGILAGIHSIFFKIGNETLKADIDVQAGGILLVNAQFKQRRILVTPGILMSKDGVPMVLIPAGTFQMGSDNGEEDEMPVHTVYLDAFYIDVYEVTNAQYKKFVDATGYKAPRYWNDPKFNAPDQPVVGVTWYDAVAYCQWAGKHLPTEAEWEKAARGGLVGKSYPWGDEPGIGILEESSAVPSSRTSPVGNSTPNNYGIYDTDGNAWEWCSDWYDEGYYAKSSDKNPVGPGSGENRVLRGGSWSAGVYAPLRVAYRYSFNPAQTSDLNGFRCKGLLRK